MEKQRLLHIFHLNSVALLVVVGEAHLLISLLTKESRGWSFGTVNSIDLVDSIVVVFCDDRLSDNGCEITVVSSDELQSCLLSENPTGVVHHQE